MADPTPDAPSNGDAAADGSPCSGAPSTASGASPRETPANPRGTDDATDNAKVQGSVSTVAAQIDDAVKWYARRAIAIGGVLGGIVSVFTLVIGYQTLAEFRVQNEQLVTQNEFLKEQTVQTQRSTNASALSSIIADVQAEVEALDPADRTAWQPSSPLQFRIAAISRVLTPHRPSADSARLVSPERGLLLRALLGVNVDLPLSPSATFADADLRDVTFGDAELGGLNLERADLTDANFLRGRLDDVSLVDASLQGATLVSTSFRKTDLSGADLREAQFFNVDLTRANLTGAALSYADLSNARLPGVNGGENLWSVSTRGSAEDVPDVMKTPSSTVTIRETDVTVCDARSLFRAGVDSAAVAFVCRACPEQFGDAEGYAEEDPRRCGGA